jgi:hypothetical protein
MFPLIKFYGMGLLLAGSISLDSTFNSLASILFFIICFLCCHKHRWNIGKNFKYAIGMFLLFSISIPLVFSAVAIAEPANASHGYFR